MQLKLAKRKRPPPHLKPAGAKFWRQIVDEYQVEDSAGVALVTCAAECVDRMRAAQDVIADRGEIVTDRYGAPKLNPACGLEKDARSGFIAAVKALNLELEPPSPAPIAARYKGKR
ncbi:MAG: hypothetical protein PGN16_17370 [Sphingomonas phyllosphaerae]|uniref:hypothetical protein n=1 Tax=Sphingomonas phyllosphaerae TaxID=257003 RepID=UPI002FF67411